MRYVCILFVVAFAACTPEPEQLPNIVLIISDDHAWNDYGFMGHEVIQTPHIDALAAESQVYTRGYVPTSVCRPSLATMITGLFPHDHGITGNDPPGGIETMRDPVRRAMMVEMFKKSKTISEYLEEKGYVSHQSGKWWEGSPTEHGFTVGMTHGRVEDGGRHGDAGLTIGREGLAPIFDFIDAAGDSPFFVWYAPFLPHTPHILHRIGCWHKYTNRPRRPERLAKYYAMVEWFDETVGANWSITWMNRGMPGQYTLILYVSDNGWIQAVENQAMPDTLSKMSPYDAGMRTPDHASLAWCRSNLGRDEDYTHREYRPGSDHPGSH